MAELRKERGWTQQQLAERLGVHRGTVIGMEAGRNPVLARLMDAMALLGYDVALVPRGSKVTVSDP